MLIDTHTHLFWDSFKEDFDQVIERALGVGVTTVINVGVNPETSQKTAEQNTGQLKSYSTIAIHPEEAIKYWNNEEKIAEDLAKLEEIYHQHPDKIVAVGECGLDCAYFKWEDYLPEELSIDQAKDLQRKLFKAQIVLAKKLDLPLIIHCRDDRSEDPNSTQTWDEVIELTKDWHGIYHCYTGLPPTTQNLPPTFLVSFAGNMTYPKNEYLREAAKTLPLEKICLETDCPFLPPQSIRGQRNEPSSVKEIAQLVADLKGVSFEEVANQTTENVQKLLKI